MIIFILVLLVFVGMAWATSERARNIDEEIIRKEWEDINKEMEGK